MWRWTREARLGPVWTWYSNEGQCGSWFPKWPTSIPSSSCMHIMFFFPPISSWSHVSTLKFGLSLWLLWPIKCGWSDILGLPSWGMKEAWKFPLSHFWTSEFPQKVYRLPLGWESTLRNTRHYTSYSTPPSDAAARVILLSYYCITDHSRTFGVAQNSNIYLLIHLQLVQSLALLPDAVHCATSSKLDWGLKDSHTSLLSCMARTETSYNLGFFRLGSKCECPKRNCPKRVSQWKTYYLSWTSLEVT